MPEDTPALKFDQDKLRFELVSVPALRGLAAVLTFGAKKYADHNWRKGFDWSRLYGAALRHLMAHMNGEDNDPETGLSHLDHAMCCIMFLSEHEKMQLGNDDRYWPSSTKVAAAVQEVRERLKIDRSTQVERILEHEGVRRRRPGHPAGIKAEQVLEHLQSPMSISELARKMGVSATAAGYWVHRLKSSLVTEDGLDSINRKVVRYVAA